MNDNIVSIIKLCAPFLILALVIFPILKADRNLSKITSEPSEPDEKYLKQFYDELAANPNSATAYMEIARDNITAFPKPYDLDKAISDITKAIELDPNLAEAYALRALLYQHQLEQPYLAIEDLSKAIELNPNDKDSYEQRAEIYKELGEYDLAQKDFDMTDELDSEDA